ncbi:hypothetical protein ACIQNG_28055 [Streptomyces sp. NPDC091377]|uniref:hypothetical protein n=1 Tax=Streptomyces sp. NPDC091377 TaxID=3365995 RepID=UPI00382ED526
MALDPTLVVGRLFEELAAENFDFTITLTDGEDPDRWVQLRAGSINIPYPYGDPPQETLPPMDLFGTVTWSVDSWEPGRYATIDWGVDTGPAREDERRVLTRLLTRMLETYHGVPVDSGRWMVEEE